MDVYEWADSLINSSPRYATGLTELLATKPYRVSPVVRRHYDSRLLTIRSFQKIALDIFRAALNDELHPAVLHWLINETLDSFGVHYHRHLEDRHFTLPVFYRTDEVTPGRIIEIQCPGSAWGELQLAFEYAMEMSFTGRENSPVDRFTAQLTGFLKDTPIVQYFLDNASAPAGMRYFIEKTRPAVRYWGIDHNVRRGECNFIRSHTFVGIVTEDEFPRRMSKVGQGVTYDLPPYILFDQKASLVLPFWSLTRESFSDEIRELFPFTTPLLPTGIELPDGTCLTIEAFSRLPQSRRSYYLKYAGANWTLNWGSKAVYRLSNLGSGACLDFLRQCLSGYERGEIWLLQKEESQKDEIEYLTRDGAIHRERLRAKFSGYYGPDGCLGVMVMHRRHFKVHGQEETVLSYVLADSEGGNAP